MLKHEQFLNGCYKCSLPDCGVSLKGRQRAEAFRKPPEHLMFIIGMGMGDMGPNGSIPRSFNVPSQKRGVSEPFSNPAEKRLPCMAGARYLQGPCVDRHVLFRRAAICAANVRTRLFLNTVVDQEQKHAKTRN